MSKERKRELVENILQKVPKRDIKKDRAILEKMDADSLENFSEIVNLQSSNESKFWKLFKKNIGLKD